MVKNSVKIGVVSAVLLLTASLFASGKTETGAEAVTAWSVNGKTGTVQDTAGNAVPLAEYKRIVVASPGAVETLYLIGGESRIAAIADSTGGTWPQDKTSLLPSVGNVARPSQEAIIALSPDLVILSAMSVQLSKDLAGRGYKTLVHGAATLDDIMAATLILGSLTGRDAEAQALVNERKAALERVSALARENPVKLKGAFLYSANPVMAFTDDSLPGEILDILGVENIAAGLDAARPILSSETLIAENPDFLFGAMSISKIEDILGSDSPILKTRAGKEKNIRIVPSSLFLRPSPRVVESILDLQAQLLEYGEKR